MLRYSIRRLGLLLVTLLLTSVLIFVITQMLPGDVARVILGREAGEASLTQLRQELGLNDPAVIQYLRWLGHFVTGDWGVSYATRTEILPMVLERLGNSLILAGLTLLISIPLGIGFGILAGMKENRPADHVISLASLSMVGLPEFITGLVLIQLFAIRLPLFPATSTLSLDLPWYKQIPALILPAITASLVLLAYLIRLTRAGVLEELMKAYIRTANLKGLPYRIVIFKHLLRNALLPIITVIAISIGWLISGLVVIENVFNYPGLGRLLTFAVDRRDIPLLQAVTMIAVLGFGVANLAADLLNVYLDPRIHYQ